MTKPINLIDSPLYFDVVTIDYSGPGYYSGKIKAALNNEVLLERVAETSVKRGEVIGICKELNFKVVPILLEDCCAIPIEWNTNVIQEQD